MARDPKTGRKIVEQARPAKQPAQHHGLEVYEPQEHGKPKHALFARAQPWEPVRPWERVQAAFSRWFGLSRRK